MNRSSKKLLEEIFDHLCRDLRDRLQNGEEVVIGDRIEKVACKPATLAVIRQFLKDNDIQAIPTDNSELQRLAEALPEDFGEDGADNPSPDTLH